MWRIVKEIMWLNGIEKESLEDNIRHEMVAICRCEYFINHSIYYIYYEEYDEDNDI